jgi:hypothetical protein
VIRFASHRASQPHADATVPVYSVQQQTLRMGAPLDD